MFKFLHAADIHLDSPLLGLERYEGAPVDAIRQASRRALENLVELALAEKVQFLLLAGDIFNGDWKDFNTGLFFIRQMARLSEAGIPVYFIAGNHDAANRMTRTLRLPRHVTMLPAEEPATHVLGAWDVAIHGQSFATPAVTDDLTVRYPVPLPGCFNIGLLHTCATGREGHERYAPCTVEGLLARGYDYWALGHIHQRDILCEHPFIIFPGNLQGRHIRERGPKGAMLITVSDGGRAQPEFCPLDTFRWELCEVSVDGAEDEEAVLGAIDRGLESVGQTGNGSVAKDLSPSPPTPLSRSGGEGGTHSPQSPSPCQLPLGVRVVVSGTTAAHGRLLADTCRLTNEVRALAKDHIWIEKVVWQTQAEPATKPWSREGPLGELLGLLEQLDNQPGQLQQIGQDMKDLQDLARKMQQQTGLALPWQNPEDLRALLTEVGPLLTRHLFSRGIVG